MVRHGETVLFGNDMLTLLDGFVEEFFDGATPDAQQMVMMIAIVQLEYRLNPLEIMPIDDPGRLELRQYPVYGSDANLFACLQ